ncbi:MAG: hypothetical protein Q9M82_00015 [Mariprofundus sp.]|nr:hypothetical protein [Mariprofundus sp.]
MKLNRITFMGALAALALMMAPGFEAEAAGAVVSPSLVGGSQLTPIPTTLAANTPAMPVVKGAADIETPDLAEVETPDVEDIEVAEIETPDIEAPEVEAPEVETPELGE